VTSVPGKGSTFTVKLLLFGVAQPRAKSFAEDAIRGYLGPRRTVLVVDDDPVHRLMVREILSPLGFVVLEAPDGPSCLRMAEDARPDLYLLDISMPGMSGWQVAHRLRESRRQEPGRGAIVMVSANATDLQRAPAAHDVHHGQLVKPIVVAALLDTIGRLLGLEWTADRPDTAADAPESNTVPDFSAAELPPHRRIAELRQLGHIGYVRGIHAKLDEIETETPAAVAFVSRMRSLVQGLEMHRYMSILEAVGEAVAHDDR
jgi:CheY-like chemotaxis protein